MLAVEHFQQNKVDWNDQNGTVIFFQNENPHEVPNQASWVASASQKGSRPRRGAILTR